MALNGLHAHGASTSSSSSEQSAIMLKASVDLRARILDWDNPLPEWVGNEEGRAIWPDMIMSVVDVPCLHLAPTRER